MSSRMCWRLLVMSRQAPRHDPQRLPKDLPNVSGDRVQIQQVLLNLIVNGMDAMSTVEESKRLLIICGFAKYGMECPRSCSVCRMPAPGSNLKN